MIINEDFFNDKDIDISPALETEKADSTTMSHTMTITMNQMNSLSVRKFDPKYTIDEIKTVLKKCDLFSDYSFESISFKSMHSEDNEEIYTFNDTLPSMSHIYNTYAKNSVATRLVVKLIFNIMPEEDVSKAVFTRQFYTLMNKLYDYVVYHSNDYSTILFTETISDKSSEQLEFNSNFTDIKVRSVYEVLYGKYEPIMFNNVIQKVNFENIYNNALREFKTNDFFKPAIKIFTFGQTVGIETDGFSTDKETSTGTVYLHINIENHQTVNVGVVYKAIKILIFDKIPQQFIIRNNVVVVIKFSDEKLVEGLSRVTLDIPFDTRQNKKLRLAATIKPVNFFTIHTNLKSSARFCEIMYLVLGRTGCYLTVPKKNGYLFKKDLMLNSADRYKINNTIEKIITRNLFEM